MIYMFLSNNPSSGDINLSCFKSTFKKKQFLGTLLECQVVWIQIRTDYQQMTKVTTSKERKGSHRLEKYLNIQDCLEKSLKIKLALKST